MQSPYRPTPDEQEALKRLSDLVLEARRDLFTAFDAASTQDDGGATADALAREQVEQWLLTAGGAEWIAPNEPALSQTTQHQGHLWAERFRDTLYSLPHPEDTLIDLFEGIESYSLRRHSEGPIICDNQGEVKSRGAFYTPKALAERMVAAALDNWRALDDSGESGRPRRLFDPAMGGGRFLVAGFRRLMAAFPDVSPLDLARRSIYGADLNPRAVQFAQSVFAIAVARATRERGESVDGIQGSDFVRNLVLADSLSGAPAEEVVDLFSLPPEPSLTNALPAAEGGGFDLIVANPPYGADDHVAGERERYYASVYETARGQSDTWALFLEATTRWWLRPGGRYVFVVPDAILVREQYAPLRRCLMTRGAPDGIEHAGNVFETVRMGDSGGSRRQAVSVSVVVLSGAQRPWDPAGRLELREANTPWEGPGDRFVPHTQIAADPSNRFLIYARAADHELIRRAGQSGQTVGDLLCHRGFGRGEERGKGSLGNRPSPEADIPVVPGESVRPFHISPSRRYVSQLTQRKKKYYEWRPKLMVVKTGRRLIAARDTNGLACLQSVYTLHPRDERALTVLEVWLNSDACARIVEATITAYKKLMPQVTQDELRSLPVPPISDAEYEEVERLTRELSATGDNERERDRLLQQLRGFSFAALEEPSEKVR